MSTKSLTPNCRSNKPGSPSANPSSTPLGTTAIFERGTAKSSVSWPASARELGNNKSQLCNNSRRHDGTAGTTRRTAQPVIAFNLRHGFGSRHQLTHGSYQEMVDRTIGSPVDQTRRTVTKNT